MYKLALTAGHYLGTPGKRCLASIDPNETKEWQLNARVADMVTEGLRAYDGMQLLRTDDTTGQTEVTLNQRVTAANRFGADFYLSIHHNAGIRGGDGGGIVVYVHPDASDRARVWQKELYDALIEATGLAGNRAEPLAEANLYECRETLAPAVLLELGFMDSTTDTPIILTEDYASKCADAIVSVIVNHWGLTEKGTETVTVADPCEDESITITAEAASEIISALDEAEASIAKVRSALFDSN